jgi:methionyl-tRNA synthetase
MTNYSYDRRQASETPSFDAVVKRNLEPKLQVAYRKAVKVADKIEDVLNDSTPWPKRVEVMQKLCAESAQAAYVVMDLLRPILIKGRAEALNLRLNDATALSDELHLLDGHRNALFGFMGKQDHDSYEREWETLTHTIAMSISYVSQFYKQLKQSYHA